MNPSANLSDADLVTSVIGFFMPPLIAVIQQPLWSSRLRALMTFALCIVAGALNAYFAGSISGGSLVHRCLVIFIAAIAAYHGFWQPTGAADAVEHATIVPALNQRT